MARIEIISRLKPEKQDRIKVIFDCGARLIKGSLSIVKAFGSALVIWGNLLVLTLLANYFFHEELALQIDLLNTLFTNYGGIIFMGTLIFFTYTNSRWIN